MLVTTAGGWTLLDCIVCAQLCELTSLLFACRVLFVFSGYKVGHYGISEFVFQLFTISLDYLSMQFLGKYSRELYTQQRVFEYCNILIAPCHHLTNIICSSDT